MSNLQHIIIYQGENKQHRAAAALKPCRGEAS